MWKGCIWRSAEQIILSSALLHYCLAISWNRQHAAPSLSVYLTCSINLPSSLFFHEMFTTPALHTPAPHLSIISLHLIESLVMSARKMEKPSHCRYRVEPFICDKGMQISRTALGRLGLTSRYCRMFWEIHFIGFPAQTWIRWLIRLVKDKGGDANWGSKTCPSEETGCRSGQLENTQPQHYLEAYSLYAQTNQWSAPSTLCPHLTPLLIGINSSTFFFFLLHILKWDSLPWMCRKEQQLNNKCLK